MDIQLGILVRLVDKTNNFKILNYGSNKCQRIARFDMDP